MDTNKYKDDSKTFNERHLRAYKILSHPSEGEDVVITGMAGKFPDSNDVYHFRDNLYNKVDLVSGDYRRWKPIYPEVPQRTGKLFDVEKFDAGFFGVTHTRSHIMDPMLRMLYEKCFESIVDAGYNPEELAGTNTGVFVGACASETEATFYDKDLPTGDAIHGCTRSMLAQNLSYYFKLTGPSFVTDTACSSSMFALEHGYRAIRSGLCDKAVIAGASLCLHPIVSLQFARLGVLSPDGLCKTFDEAANGYARSEAICVLLLEKSRDARRIYAHVVHMKTNCDGFKEKGITYPSSELQTELMKEFYRECEIDPTSITFVEAHGTGTRVGDPEEITTMDEVFCTGRDRPLHVGGVKSNIGHTEQVSGLCSIVKVLIGMENGFIPPNINFNKPRTDFTAFTDGRMKVVSEKMPWPDQNGLVAVNSFGFGGANGHVLLRWNQKAKISDSAPMDNLPRLICVSGRTSEAVRVLLDDIKERQLDCEYIKLLHVVFGKEISGHLYRGYSIVNKNGEVKRVIEQNNVAKKKICLVFTGFDEDWLKIGLNLLSIPLFAATIQQIQDIFTNETNINISDVITNHKQENLLNKILGTVAIQICLAEILRSIGVVPEVLVGVATGELLTAYFEGFLNLKSTVLASFYIGLAMCKEDKNTFNEEQMKNFKQLIPEDNNFYEKLSKSHRTNKNGSYRQGSAEYFLECALSPVSIEKAFVKGSLTIVVGPAGNNYKHNVMQLVKQDSSDPTLSLLQNLGCLFQNGYNMRLDEIYPYVQWPVSRGTPMISPLIKWDHMTDYQVNLCKNEVANKGSVYVSNIAAQTDDWNFVIGHVIDGRNLFPATGYLFLVWETLAMMKGKLTTDMKICFESVKFMRACNVPSKGHLELIVLIQNGTKQFEVTEGDDLIVSGKIYEIDEEKALMDLPQSHWTGPEDMVLNQRDIYKELHLRGYYYKGLFRGLTTCNINLTKGQIQWIGNWISFMDCMLQMQILSIDSRNLYVPTGIQRVIIDAPTHREFARQYEDTKMLPVLYNKHSRLIRSGAIEIIGASANSIPRRRGGDLVLETYKFVPNEGVFTLNESVRVMTQIILENTNLIKVKSIEIDDGRNLLSPIVLKTLDAMPLIQPEIVVLSKKNLVLNGIIVEDKALNTDTNATLVIVTDIFGEGKDIKELINVIIKSKGYIISRERSNFDVSSINHAEIEVLCVHRNQEETLVLLKLSVEKKLTAIVDVSENESWLEKLQDAVKTNNDVIVVSKRGRINGILGLVNCLRRETNGGKISCVFMMDDAPTFDPSDKFYEKQLLKNFSVNVWKDSKWGTYRHLLLDEVENVESEHCYVNVTLRGDLSSLQWIESSLNKNMLMKPEKTLVHVYTSAINFRDVMTASGRIAADVITMDRTEQDCVQGFEFSGRDSTGKRVMGMVNSGALSTIIIADSHLLWPIPDHWSMEDAATVPVVYGTVIYSLLIRAQMKFGQSILIHSGAGGVGQAAINIALHYGCTVFTTVGTQEKRDFIKRNYPKIKDTHIGNSRDTSFEQMIYVQTKGRGVDIILNSLAEEKLQASVRCLASNGTFLEIGKFDLSRDNNLPIQKFSKQASFEGVMLDAIFLATPDVKRALTVFILEGIENGAIKPLLKTVFEKTELEQAFRFMATGKHIGKVLVRVREEETERLCMTPHQTFKGIPRFYCRPDESVIIIGGLGGFGLELADWLIIRGAKNLVLTSRSGVKTGYQSLRLSFWRTYGTNILIRKDDASTIEGCTEIIKAANSLAPVGAIFNLAVVLKDALFENQSLDDFNEVMLPKANATKNLDVLSRKLCPNLKEFVIFSSVSCGRGNPGQTNYGMANSIMERICEQRHVEGYPALAVQWGAIGDVGLVAEMQEEYKEMVIGGTLQQKMSSCLQVLDKFLRQKSTIVASMVVAEKRTSAAGANSIIDTLIGIIGIRDVKTVSSHATFPELGMDSMMAVEIKQTLEREYEVFLTPQDLRTMTLSKLQKLASEKMECVEPSKTTAMDSGISENIRLLLRQIGNEELSNIPVLHLESFGENESTVYMLPGIEGLGVPMEALAKNLSAKVNCLQYGSSNISDTVESLAETIYPHMKLTEGDFMLVAHSFGCMIATELVHLLELNGRYGKIIFIDGSCDLMQQMVKTYLDVESEAQFQTSILCSLMHRYMPSEEILNHMPVILKCKTYEDRIQYVLSVSPKIEFSTKYITEMYCAVYLRLKAILKYTPDFGKLKSKIKLFKPIQPTVQGIADDYGLSKRFENVVSVETFEGDHLTILDNPSVADECNKFFRGDNTDNVPRIL